jgi:hypothetical protein
MPAYLCHTVGDAAKKAGVQLHFYPIDCQLQISDTGWIDNINETDLVLFIDYFGFSSDRSILKQVKEKGGIVVEDGAHSLLSQYDRSYTDYVLFSPRKLIGIPAGAILMAMNEDVDFGPLQPAPRDALNAVYQAFLMRTAFDKGNETDNNWFGVYKQAEALQPTGDYAIDDFSRSLLDIAFDYETIASKRRRNFLFLLDRLEDIATYKTLPDDVVPLGFPVLLDNRDTIQKELFKHNIFCPIHWPIDGVIPKNYHSSFDLNKRILTLICDQRYSIEQLEQMVDIMESRLP